MMNETWFLMALIGLGCFVAGWLACELYLLSRRVSRRSRKWS